MAKSLMQIRQEKRREREKAEKMRIRKREADGLLKDMRAISRRISQAQEEEASS